MKGQWMRVAGAITLLGVAGCQTPRAMGSGAMSASDSGSGDSSQSNSGQSSQSGSSQASSEASKASSDNLSQLSKSDSSQSNSESSKASSDNSTKNSDSSHSQSGSGVVLSVTTVGGTVVGLGMLIWVAVKALAVAPAPAAVAQAAQSYLRARNPQLREDLALGAGPTIEDLAAMARIRRENLRTFGLLLREHRSELLTLADASTLTPERAMSWLQRVGEIARTEPRLEEDRRAFLAAYGVTE